ncbi:hypothetical protein Tco_0408837 [Tanacetum coccineum]
MVYVVNGVLASGVDMLLEKDLVGFALQEMKIHQLMLQTLSMIFQTISPTLHNPSTRHTRASHVEMILTMAASIDQSPLQEMIIQDMEDLKQHYLYEMLSLSNDLQIKDYCNEKIYIHFRRECESMIDELKGKFNGMSIEINKKKELQHLDQVADLSTYPSTIPEKEYDEVIKSSVEDLCSYPSGDVDEIEFLLHHNRSTPKISVVSILEGFIDEPPLEENDDLFDLESKENEWKKILYDASIDDCFGPRTSFRPPGFIEKNFSYHM